MRAVSSSLYAINVVSAVLSERPVRSFARGVARYATLNPETSKRRRRGAGQPRACLRRYDARARGPRPPRKNCRGARSEARLDAAEALTTRQSSDAYPCHRRRWGEADPHPFPDAAVTIRRARTADIPQIQRCNRASLPENYNDGFYARHLADWGQLAYVRRADLSPTNRGGAAATTWIVRGDESRRRRGYDVDSPWR